MAGIKTHLPAPLTAPPAPLPAPNKMKYYIAPKYDQSFSKGVLWGAIGVYFAAAGLAMTAMNLEAAARGAWNLLGETFDFEAGEPISAKALIAWTLLDLVAIKIALSCLKNAGYHLGARTHVIALTELKKIKV